VQFFFCPEEKKYYFWRKNHITHLMYWYLELIIKIPTSCGKYLRVSQTKVFCEAGKAASIHIA
jgi:hypothetical protein